MYFSCFQVVAERQELKFKVVNAMLIFVESIVEVFKLSFVGVWRNNAALIMIFPIIR